MTATKTTTTTGLLGTSADSVHQMRTSSITNNGKRKLTFAEELFSKLFAGSIAGVTGVSICYPIDFAKTKLQKPRPGVNYTGIFNVLQRAHAKGGFSMWYKGLRPNLAGIIPEKGLKLAVFDLVRDKLRNPTTGAVSQQSECISAVTAAVVQVIVTTPMEMVKINCQLTGKPASTVMYELGLRGLYKGYISTLARDVSFNLAFFPLQSYLKATLICNRRMAEKEKLFYSFVAGITAGCVAAFISTPLDVIKTRLQSGERGNVVTIGSNIVKYEGVGSLFLGWWPRVAAIAPLFGIAICIYDLQKRVLRSFDFDIPE